MRSRLRAGADLEVGLGGPGPPRQKKFMFVIIYYAQELSELLLQLFCLKLPMSKHLASFVCI